jgi:hypothetical protein
MLCGLLTAPNILRSTLLLCVAAAWPLPGVAQTNSSASTATHAWQDAPLELGAAWYPEQWPESRW